MKQFRHNALIERTLAGLYRVDSEPLPIESILEQLSNQNISLEIILREVFSRIFFTYRNPSPGDMFAMDLMLEALRKGALKIETEFISLNPDIPDEPEIRENRRGRTVESAEHKAMKSWVRMYLFTKEIQVAADEVSKLGYEVDVGSIKQDIFLECGDTEPSKVLEFLRNGLNIGILQYDSEEIVWFKTSSAFQNLARLENFI